jgi:hypothetical protein
MTYSRGQDKKAVAGETRRWWRFYLGLPDLLLNFARGIWT